MEPGCCFTCYDTDLISLLLLNLAVFLNCYQIMISEKL